MAASLGKLTVTVIVDRPAVERAREELRATFDDLGIDPVLVHEMVDRIMQTAPVVRYIET